MLQDRIATLLRQLSLSGMLEAFERQLDNPAYGDVGFCERLEEFLVGESDARCNRRMQRLLKAAKLRHHAPAEGLIFDPSRGLDKAMMRDLQSCHWIERHQNVLITGPAGVGKTHIANHLAYEAVCSGKSARYFKTGPLLADLSAAHHDHSIGKLHKQLTRVDVIILDDFALADSLNERAQEDLFDLLDNRTDQKSTIFVGQRPVDQWYDYIGKPRIADAIMDRIFNRAYRIQLTGESMRR